MSDKINDLKFQELRTYARELEKQLDDKTSSSKGEEFVRLKTELAQYQAEQAGWLVTTPNPLYDGKTCDVKFEHGMAFIPQTREFPRFRNEPLKEAYVEKHKLSQEAILQLRVREARSTAQVVVERLAKDFHYTVEFFEANQIEAMRQRITARDVEFQRAYEAAKSSERAAKLLSPRYIGDN